MLSQTKLLFITLFSFTLLVATTSPHETYAQFSKDNFQIKLFSLDKVWSKASAIGWENDYFSPGPIQYTKTNHHGESSKQETTFNRAVAASESSQKTFSGKSPKTSATDSFPTVKPLAKPQQLSTPIEKLRTPSNKIGQPVNALLLNLNLLIEDIDEVINRVDRAKLSGANTVILSDTKIMRWALDDSYSEKWMQNLTRLRAATKQRNMKFVVNTVALGFAGSFIASDRNLATGYPIYNQPMQVKNGALEPINTSKVANGGFEKFKGHVPQSWSWQDDPGSKTFIDTKVKHSGTASFKGAGRGMVRVRTGITLKPWHQYTLKAWVKMTDFSGSPEILIKDSKDNTRLSNQFISVPKSNGSRTYLQHLKNKTLDWNEVKISFNSQDSTSTDLMLAAFNQSSGAIWWDDISIVDTPTMNFLKRDGLNVSVKKVDGTKLKIPDDIARPEDSSLGLSGYAGRYDNYHSVPSVKVNNSNKIRNGDILLLSGWHTMVTTTGQISASWNHPRVFQRIRKLHQKIHDELKPDGFLYSVTEVRTGGFEPWDTQYITSGKALDAHIKRGIQEIKSVAPGKEIYLWDDMISPFHNAKDGYYQVNNTLKGAGESINPNDVVIIPWWEGQKIAKNGLKTLKYFEERGFSQVIGGFYDENVATNYQFWKDASQGVRNIRGSVYSTWVKDYSKIEDFGAKWWKQESSMQR